MYAGRDSRGVACNADAPLSFTFGAQLARVDALSRFSNVLELVTCHLVRHKSAEMPPKVPFHFFSFCPTTNPRF